MTTINELEADRTVEGVYAVARKRRLRTRNGAAYLALELIDSSGRIDARVWNDVELLDQRFGEGDAVRVLGRVEKYHDRLQLDVRSIEPAADVDPAQMAPAIRRDADELEGFLEFLVAEIHNDPLRGLVTRALGQAQLRAFPATPDGHHSYAGGLLEHTVGVATLCRETAQLHPRLRPDLLIAAALVHDVGRTRELGPPPVFAPTEDGRLLGHVHLGLRMLEDLGAPAELLHAVACHHDVRAARTAEAAVLYHANQLDAVAATRPVPHGLTAVVLALAASLSWGIADFGAGVGSRRLPPLVVGWGMQLTGCIVAAAVVLVLWDHPPTWQQALWAVTAGTVGLVGVVSLYTGLSIGPMGVVGPLSTTAALVPLAYGLARGERPSSLQLAGVALAIVGIIGASLEPLPEGRGRKVGAGVGFGLFAALGFGWSLIALNEAAAGGTPWAVLIMRLCAVPTLFLLASARGLPRPQRSHWKLIAGVGLFDTAATLLYAAASTRGLLSVVAVLASLYPIVIIVCARVFLHERVARAQLAGAAVALAGVALVSAGG